MSLSIQVLLPVLALALAGLTLLWQPRTAVLLLGEAAALASLAWLWQLTAEGPISALSYQPLAGVSVGLRVDRLGAWFAGCGALAGVLLALSLGARTRVAGVVVLAQAAAVLAALSGSLLGLAATWGLAAALLVLASSRGARASAPVTMLGGGALLLLAGAVTVEVAAGTTAFESVPVAAMGTGPVLLLGACPVLALLTIAGLLRAIPDLRSASLAVVSVATPTAAYMLVRLYDLGEGRLPSASLGLGLAGLAGLVALGCAAWAAWAVDLGAFTVRVVQSQAALMLVGAATVSAAGVGALELGVVGLSLSTTLLVALLLSGGGRLPVASGSSRPGRAAVGAMGVLAMAGVSGLPVGVAFATRSLVLRGALAAGPTYLLAAAPAALAMVVLPVAAVLAGRFAGGRAIGRLEAVRPLLAATVFAAAALLVPGAVVTALAGLTAPAVGQTAAEVASALHAGVLAVPVAGVALLAVLALALGPWARSAPGGGWRGGREVLPPELAVAPRVVLARLRPRLRQLLDRATGLAEGRPGMAMLVAWGAAAAGAVLAFSR